MSGSVTRRELERLGELLGVCVLAITMPVLDVFGRTPEQFVFRGASSADIVLFSLAVAFVPAGVLWLPGAITRRIDRRVGAAVHVAAITVAVFVMLLQLLGVSGVTKLLLAGALTGAGVWVFQRFAATRLWTRTLSLGAPALIGVFLLASPTGDLAFADPPELVELAGPAQTEPPGSDTSAGDLPRYPDVVMIMLDSLPTGVLLDPTGAIDRSRYPAVAGFADDATWYRRYTTVNAKTAMAVPTILSGRLPTSGVSPTWTEHPDTIFRLLGGTYHLTASESATRLCPEDWCGPEPIPPPAVAPRFADADSPASTTTVAPLDAAPPDVDRGGLSSLLGDAVDVWRDQIALERDVEPVRSGFEEIIVETRPVADTTTTTSSPPSTADAPTVDELGEAGAVEVFTERTAELPRVEGFRAAISASDRPTLYYLHVVLPHAPYLFDETGATYTAPSFSTLTEAEWDSALHAQRLSLQMQFTDQLVADVLGDLRAAGIYDDALVVLMADHAAGLDDTRLFRYFDGTNASELMVTPLMIKGPGQTSGIVSDAPVEAIDVLPTLADMLDVEVPWEVDGESALDQDPGYVDPGCDDVRHYVRVGENLLGDGEDDDTDAFEFCANDVVPAGLVPLVGESRRDDEWAVAPLARRTPFDDLLGRPWDELAPAVSATTVTLDLHAATLEGGAPPVGVVGGTIDEPIAAEWVAVAIDGRIAGISPIYDRRVHAAVEELVADARYLDDSADNQFRVVVPSPLLHSQGYDVRVAALEMIDAELVATELPLAGRQS